MARPKRKPAPGHAAARTIERVAIAALAAIAARDSGERIAVAAVVIFLVVVIVEELGRRWFWHGAIRTLRDVALSSVGDLRVWLSHSARGVRKRRKRSRHRARRRGNTADKAHASQRKI